MTAVWQCIFPPLAEEFYDYPLVFPTLKKVSIKRLQSATGRDTAAVVEELRVPPSLLQAEHQKFLDFAGGKNEITLEQASKYLRLERLAPSTADVEELRKQLMKETISFDELVRWKAHIRRIQDQDNPRDLSIVFRQFDLNNTGTMPAQSIRNVLVNYGEVLSNEEVSTLFKILRINPEDQAVDYNTFIERLIAAK